MNIKGGLASFGIVAAIASPAFADDPPLPGPIPATVLRVVDGDTIEVMARIWPGQQVNVMVRIAGIDAPETFRPNCSAERETGRRATAAIGYLLDGDVQLTQVEHDKYGGRVVASVRDDLGRDIGDYLMGEGLAIAYGDDDPWCDPFALASLETAAVRQER